MKTFFKDKMNVLIALLLLLVVLTSCAPAPEAVAFHSAQQGVVQTSAAAQIPEALIIFFNGLVVAVFTAGTIWIFEKIHWDFRQYAIPLAATFSTWVVVELQGYINTIPDVNDFYINLAFRILLALLPAAGILRILSRQPSTLIEHE